MINQTRKRFLRNPKFWHIVVLSVTLFAMCQFFSSQTFTNQITLENNLPGPSATTNPNSFISTWNTSITGPGSSNDNQIMLPLISGGVYNFNVQWGDGSNSNITTSNQNAHNYGAPGIYTVNITGQLNGWEFKAGYDCNKIIGISQWGNITLGNTGYYFYGCSNLVITATDTLNLTGTYNMDTAFAGCSKLGGSGDFMSGWNVSSVTNMNEMFGYDPVFNQPIGNWNVSSVTNMNYMFGDDLAFNQPIGNWNVSSVTDMGYMFFVATAFNQPIGNWSVSSVTNMNSMFYDTFAFNRPIDNWDVSSVTDMNSMFYNDTTFNQPLDNWNVSSVTDMSQMFMEAAAFNQPLDSWNVSNVQSSWGMFMEDTAFNQNISGWNVSSDTDTDYMFCADVAFNQPIGNWDVSNDQYTYGMFCADLAFNQPIGSWNVSSDLDSDSMFMSDTVFNQDISNWNVSSDQDTDSMFYNDSAFNQPIGNWNVSSDTLMYDMFHGDKAFNQNIGSWNVSNVNDMTNMFTGDNAFSSTNYDALLIGWSQLHLQMNINFSAGSTRYSPGAAATARQDIINTYNWTITDGGLQTTASEPTNLNAKAESNSILLTWEAPASDGGSTILHYNIYRSDSANGTFTLIGNSTTTSYNDTNVTTGQTYYYEVTAVNSVGSSNYSNVANATASSSSTTHKSINGMGIGEILSVSFLGALFVSITMRKRKNT